MRFENVASVASTVPLLLRIWTLSVSYAVTVVVSAVSMCSQNVSVAEVLPAGMVTVWRIESVCAEPYPSIHAFHEPLCAAWPAPLSMTPVVTVHGAGLAEPFSKPVLPRSCEAETLLTVTLTVAEVPMLPAAS